MCVVTSRSKEIDEEEQVAPPIVRHVVPLVVRQVAPSVAHRDKVTPPVVR
jgi:hypothetical protein